MTALIVIAVIVGAVVAFSAIAEAIRRLRGATRLERAIEAGDRHWADIKAMVAPREPAAWERRETCGCYWAEPGPYFGDPVWVPCDEHAETLLRAVEDGEDL